MYRDDEHAPTDNLASCLRTGFAAGPAIIDKSLPRLANVSSGITNRGHWVWAGKHGQEAARHRHFHPAEKKKAAKQVRLFP
jgi:hypothetical protein